ncbi:DNA-binding transcriptional regulator, Lrp family [Haladaptatus litoreus]|uniref:DNA-binding transcriptional regulator, Lrp family n=1 Tax=Haladaptatus litoreus TaxID=553468 RepID=A0A1N7E0B9_9EURY|nr:Lrp/AsnC family transcriptional regulator [Haladaptatus litoreus]SIR81498.1 DNA-binding transcriptional regulator, Lrp family [Haladaptatus litoreus]
MEPIQLDDVDRGILHVLQNDARNSTAAGMGEQVGVSASTVRNRIERLEKAGVIRGYNPDIDYERANYQLHVLIVCRAPPDERSTLADEVMEITGVVTIRELLTGTENIHIEAIAVDSDTVDSITEQIHELGLDIVSTNIIKIERVQPFDHFGKEVTER